MRYEIWYVELRYGDKSRTWMTSSDPKKIAFKEVDDEKAVALANQLLNAPSDDPMVDRRVLSKLVRIIDIKGCTINPPPNYTFDEFGVSH